MISCFTLVSYHNQCIPHIFDIEMDGNHLDRLPHTCVMTHEPRPTTGAEKTIIWCSDFPMLMVRMS